MEEKEPLLENQRIERRRTSDPRLFLTNKAGFFTRRKRLKKLKEVSVFTFSRILKYFEFFIYTLFD